MAQSTTLPSLTSEYIAQDCSPRLKAVAICFVVLETFFISLRFVSKRLGKKGFETDDALILLAWACGTGMCITSLIGISLGGVGRHSVVVAEGLAEGMTLDVWGKVVASQAFFYAGGCTFSRLAVLCLYLRIFPKGAGRKISQILVGLLTAQGLVIFILGAVICIPLEKFWDPSTPGHCLDVAGFYRWAALPNVIFDTVTLLVPLPVIWKLHVTRQTKIGLIVTFLLGSLGTATSIIRTVFFFTEDIFGDATWTSAIIMTWTIVEPGVYVIAACLLCYRPLIQHLTHSGNANPGHNTRSPTANHVSRRFSKRQTRNGLQALDSHCDEHRLVPRAEPSYIRALSVGLEASSPLSLKHSGGTELSDLA